MEEIFLKRLEDLEVSKEEKKIIQKNLQLCSKIYFRGIKDVLLQTNEIKKR